MGNNWKHRVRYKAHDGTSIDLRVSPWLIVEYDTKTGRPKREARLIYSLDRRTSAHTARLWTYQARLMEHFDIEADEVEMALYSVVEQRSHRWWQNLYSHK